ncbi:MAG TPA: hypothetical protein DCR20_02630 [Planctomycetaceae bacterium]|nr:hypothetical protein [Planctomycetaceae bacterium]
MQMAAQGLVLWAVPGAVQVAAAAARSPPGDFRRRFSAMLRQLGLSWAATSLRCFICFRGDRPL